MYYLLRARELLPIQITNHNSTNDCDSDDLPCNSESVIEATAVQMENLTDKECSIGEDKLDTNIQNDISSGVQKLCKED